MFSSQHNSHLGHPHVCAVLPTTRHVGDLCQLLHNIVQSGVGAVHFMGEVIQHAVKQIGHSEMKQHIEPEQ